jgi:hypothetical protein
LLDASLGCAHQRKLGGDEEAVQTDEHGDAEQEQELGHLRPSACEARAGEPFVCLLRGGSSSLMR